MTKQEQVVANYPALMTFVKTKIGVPYQDRRDVVHTAIARCLASDNPESCTLSYMFRALVSTVQNHRRTENRNARKIRKLGTLGDVVRYA
jgi:DNA-directed RNA polymerase specialized sigma24 family protein